MKKLLLLSVLTLTVLGLSAQVNTEDREVGTTTKSGQKILPQAGDYAIGVDATSFLKYAGNMFNGNTDNKAPNFGFDDQLFENGIFDAPTIYAKYFLADDRAVRVKLHLGFKSKTTKYTDGQIPAPTDTDPFNPFPTTVTNERKYSTSGLGLTAGYEIRRGYGRLQGFFGPEVGLGFMSYSETYKYGNEMTEEYITNGGIRARDTKKTSPSTFAMKLGGFAGVEYFIAPKISLGGEVSLAVKYTSNGKESQEVDVWNSTDKKINSYKRELEGGSQFNFGVAYTAALNATFHF